MAHLEELRCEFSEHDVFLHLLLGLVSLSRRLERVLPEVPLHAGGTPPRPLADEEERRMLLLLGLVSMRRTLMRTLEPLRAAGHASESTAGSGPRVEPPSPRELLR